MRGIGAGAHLKSPGVVVEGPVETRSEGTGTIGTQFTFCRPDLLEKCSNDVQLVLQMHENGHTLMRTLSSLLLARPQVSYSEWTTVVFPTIITDQAENFLNPKGEQLTG